MRTFEHSGQTVCYEWSFDGHIKVQLLPAPDPNRQMLHFDEGDMLYLDKQTCRVALWAPTVRSGRPVRSGMITLDYHI